jgi:phage-related protein
MDVVVLKQAKKEVLQAPEDVVSSILSLLEELAKGKNLSMPICRPMASVHKGLYELRLSRKSGEYRVFYLVKIGDAIYVLHATKKKTQKTSQQTIRVIKSRIRSIE